MAVELRCPQCKAKLRLPIEPEPDSEIECPKCEHVFACEENLVHAGSAGDKPGKKKSAADDEKPKKADKKPEGEQQPKKRKKKKSKKKKTPPLVIAGIVAGVLMFLAVAGAAVWFFTKKSSSQEMMTYLPDDCNVVFGLNLGHIQKYPEFYKSCQPTFANTGFKKAGDTLAKALGSETIDDVVDYVVQGVGKSGGAVVFKTKVEYDPGQLAKIPGAKEYVLNGVKYYTIPDIRELGYPGLRVFGPTNRLVVFCSAVPEDKFKLMLEGNKENMENTAYVRSGSLGKQTIRGTVWRFTVDYKNQSQRIGDGKLINTQSGQQLSEEDKMLAQEWGGVESGVKGMGIKASVGSREVRGELFVQYADAEAASSKLKSWKEKEWIKDEENDAPKWFKSLADKTGGGKTAVNIVRDGLSFKSSGDLFIVRTSMETKVLQQGVSSLVTAFSGQQQGSMGGPGSMGPTPGGGGAPMPGGGGGVPPMPGGGGVPPMPGGRRRRLAPTIPVR